MRALCCSSAWLASSSARRDLPTPASPSRSSSDARALQMAFSTLWHSRPELGLAADQPGPVALGPVPGRGDGAVGPPGRHELLAALGRRSAPASRSGRCDGWRRRSPDRRAPHPAAAARLQAVGGVHDVAHRGVVAAGAERADEHLAGVHADAHADVDVELGGVRRQASPACAARRARPARRRPRGRSGAPKRATIASPMILSTRPPKASMSATSRSKHPSMRFFTCSGSRVSERVV